MARLADHLRLPLARRLQQNLSLIAANATPAVRRAFEALPSYNEADIEAFTAAADPALRSVKTASVRQASGYYSVVAGVQPRAVPVTAVATDPGLRDPFISVWQALASGRPYLEAVGAGLTRVESLVSDFAVSTARQTGGVFMDRAGVRVSLWVRTPDSGACDWCQQVADNVFTSAEAADIGHDHCGCSIDPLFD